MSDELKHGTVGTELTQAEWEGIGTHVLDSQATGDIVYASSSSQLRRLAKGTDTHVLILSSGIPAWSATTGITAVSTIATGVWQGTDVGVAYGGTGVSTLTANGVLVGNGSSAIGSVDMSTKGHVLIGDGTGNPQMLGVGTDTHVLTADSGETTGIKWAAPAAAAAGSLTGSTLASGVTASSLTSLGAQAEALDMSSQSVTAIGNSGSQLVADAWTMTSANTQVLSIKTSATDTAVLVTLGVGASSTGGYGTLETEYIQGGGTGAANNMGYAQGYNSSAGYFYMRSRDTDGSSTDADVWRVPDAQLTVDANSTWDDNAFDYVCDACGKSAVKPFKCCGIVSWHDDVALVAAATRSGKVRDIPPPVLERMERLGVLKVDREQLLKGKPQVFMSLSKMPWFLMAGMAQLYHRIKVLEAA